MERRAYARRPQGTLDLDVCWTCHVIWFDHYESIALAPSGVLELFKAIDAHRSQPARVATNSTRCPDCHVALQLTHDIQKTNRITYFKCPNRHGRMSTFYQFLREKEFVRSLTNAEVHRLRAHVQQVRCSSCGGAIELAREMQCSYCHAPVSILDADAVKKTIEALERPDVSPKIADPDKVIDALIAAWPRGGKKTAMGNVLRVLVTPMGGGRRTAPAAMDLVDEALRDLVGKF